MPEPQTRLLDFGPAPKAKQRSAPSWQGDSSAEWQFSGCAVLDLCGLDFVAGGGPDPGAPPKGTLKVVTTNMLPGHLRKNGVPYSGNAVLTEYFNRFAGREGGVYLLVTAVVDDPAYLTQPSAGGYTFKKLPDLDGLGPTPCWTR
ncbi:MAG: hypothetical protein KGM92_18650 [Acidobacteriota bacterium]|nr:hypothetical protein [Acidobacteriota bacterium]